MFDDVLEPYNSCLKVRWIYKAIERGDYACLGQVYKNAELSTQQRDKFGTLTKMTELIKY